MEKKNLTQVFGMVLILTVVISNAIFAYMCMHNDTCQFLNTFSWGFTSGVTICCGLMMLGGQINLYS